VLKSKFGSPGTTCGLLSVPDAQSEAVLDHGHTATYQETW